MTLFDTSTLPVPAGAADPDALREAAAACTACDLYRNATQTVFGEGPAAARVMLLGEQPGDKEDRAGRPFVGPAGRLLDDALARAGIDRSEVYVTNVVKHFKFTPRGKARIHQKPNAAEQAACRPWLEAELAIVRPEVVVCLGATAAQAILGRQFRVTQQRGQLLEWPPKFAIPVDDPPLVLATVHPSSILRAPEDADRQALMDGFATDLEVVATALSR
ncbi:MAG: UdgX family uracil-DNA binding protein [Actinomycetota bacterium]|nr:UdgX family uracil-DNA binding protein [Actinomycetota bacterium]